MAYTREQIYAAMRAADKAGDGEAVRTLSRALNQTEDDTTPQAAKIGLERGEAAFARNTALLPPKQREEARAAYEASPDVQRLRKAASREDNRPTSFWQGLKEGVETGLHDLASYGHRIQDTLTGQGVVRAMMGVPDVAGSQIERAHHAARESLARAPEKSSGLGKFAGSVVGTLPAMIIPGSAPFTQGAAAGALMAEDPNDPVDVGVNAVIGGVTGKLTNMAVGHFSKPSAAAKKYSLGQQFGVDLSPGDVGGMSSKVVERVLDVQPGSASVMKASRNKLAGQLVNAAESEAGKFGPETSFREMGATAQTGARNWIDRFNGIASNLYDAIPIKTGSPASTSATTQKLAGLMDKTPSNPELSRLLSDARFSKYLDALTPKTEQVATGLVDEAGNPIMRSVTKGGGLSWDDLKAFRSDVGEQISDTLFTDGARKGELRALYGALSDDMESTARSQGAQAFAKFQRANSFYKAGQQRIDDALTKILGNDNKQAPEAAAALVQRIAREGRGSGDLGLLRNVKASLRPEEWGQISNGLVRLLGQPANSAGREFNPETFVRAYADMAPEAKSMLFGGSNNALRQSLDQFAEVVGMVAKSGGTRNTSNTAMGLAGLAGYGVGGIPGLLTQAATSFGAAKIWTSPAFVRWATGYSRAVASGEESAVKASLARLPAVASANKALAPMVERIMTAVNDNAAAALGRSPGAVAAKQEGDGRGEPPQQ